MTQENKDALYREVTRAGNIVRQIADFDHLKFLAKIRVDKNGCWLFGKNKTYASFWTRGALFRSHRLSHSLFNGDVEKEDLIDHICRVRNCVNPDHLRVVDDKTNTIENSESIQSKNKAKTHCKHGHEFDKGNTRITKFGRHCITCARANTKRHNALRKSKKPS